MECFAVVDCRPEWPVKQQIQISQPILSIPHLHVQFNLKSMHFVFKVTMLLHLFLINAHQAILAHLNLIWGYFVWHSKNDKFMFIKKVLEIPPYIHMNNGGKFFT